MPPKQMQAYDKVGSDGPRADMQPCGWLIGRAPCTYVAVRENFEPERL